MLVANILSFPMLQELSNKLKNENTKHFKKRAKSFYKPLVQTTEANKQERVTSSKIESDQFVEKTHII